MVRELRIFVPDQVHRRLEEVCRELNISVQDVLLRAIVKTLEDFERAGRGGRR